MSDEPSNRGGHIAATPEGGPLDEGIPASAPGSGQVQITPEAGPLTPPTLRDHLQGPILGLDDQPPAPAAEVLPSPSRVPSGCGETPPSSGGGPGGELSGVRVDVGEERPETPTREAEASPSSRTKEDDAELRKWPPYSGKPVSEVHWDDARRFAAPLVSQAEKLTIQAIGVTGRGLSRLARLLEERRTERETTVERDPDKDR